MRSITAFVLGVKGVANLRAGSLEIHLISTQNGWNRTNLTLKLTQLCRGNTKPGSLHWERHCGCSDCLYSPHAEGFKPLNFTKTHVLMYSAPSPRLGINHWLRPEPERAAGMSWLCVEFHQHQPAVLSICESISQIFKSLQSAWWHSFLQMQSRWLLNTTANQFQNVRKCSQAAPFWSWRKWEGGNAGHMKPWHLVRASSSHQSGL